ncbi:MAG TPA: hypothetical protein VNL92_07275 [Dehalococcoidia bacterium]|nr:hypothetical protein [Dehalococcoidia bacterium]
MQGMEYVARLEDTVAKRRDKFVVTRAMLESAAAHAAARSLPVVEGFREPVLRVGFATAFRVEEEGTEAVLLCDVVLEVEPRGRVLAPSVRARGEEWTIQFLRLVEQHKNPRASLRPSQGDDASTS